MIAELANERPVDRAKIFVAGLSAGGAMAAVLMATHPDLFAGVGSPLRAAVRRGPRHALGAGRDARRAWGHAAPIAWYPRDPACRSLIVFHGDADTTVHPANGDALADEARAAIGRSASEVSVSGSAGGRSFSRSVTCDAQGRAVVEQWVLMAAAMPGRAAIRRGTFTDPSGPTHRPR